MPGPLPKRSDERTRRNATNDTGIALKKGHQYSYKKWPEPDKNWEPRVKDWFAALGRSGMNKFYEQSDIAYAQIIADALDDWYKAPAGKRPAMKFDFAMKHMAPLGVTEGERRRMRIELEMPEIEEESVGSQAAKRLKESMSAPASITRIHPDKE